MSTWSISLQHAKTRCSWEIAFSDSPFNSTLPCPRERPASPVVGWTWENTLVNIINDSLGGFLIILGMDG